MAQAKGEVRAKPASTEDEGTKRLAVEDRDFADVIRCGFFMYPSGELALRAVDRREKGRQVVVWLTKAERTKLREWLNKVAA